jgi:ribulose-bisphosphate carboxylase large chain
MTDERFLVSYRLTAPDQGVARNMAKAVCLEQTVELDDDLVRDDGIRQEIVGRLESFEARDSSSFLARISYGVASSARELPQLLNVIFGNSSIKANIRVEGITLGPSLLRQFPGPRFGVARLRERLGVEDKPLLCTALKPMGLDSYRLAEMAYAFALGGIDIIKDDHGLTDQSFAPFNERVAACSQAVARANQHTGRHSIYAPNITAPADQIIPRAKEAKRVGAGALMIAPGLTGFDMLRLLAADDEIDLPLICHPALLGSFVTSEHQGIAPAGLFGTLVRLAGADATIYPNYGGRFGISRAECESIARACQDPLGHYPAIFPMPGGGMALEKIPDFLKLYGAAVIFLIGGSLYGRSPDLAANARYFLALVGRT